MVGRGSIGRRKFLGGLGALFGTAAAGFGGTSALSNWVRRAAVPAGSGPDERAAVAVDPDEASEWTVDERIFGKFVEHNGRDVYPGFFSDHVANGSFEVWNRTGPRTASIFDDEEHPGIAHGWSPVEQDGRVSFEHVPGGVHGRRSEPDLESGGEIPPWNWPWPRDVSDSRFQRVHLAGRGGVSQRTALPDQRTTAYDVAVTVRGEGVSDCAVELSTPSGRTLARSTVPVSSEWERREVRLDLDATAGPRYQETPFGTYDLSIRAEGEGRLDLDWLTLAAGDAVAGKFNPTTIEQLREYNVTSIRWPGGNFASQYHWRDGIGPLGERPVVPNCNWGGLERNYLGTNEFLEFCDLAGVEPLITVGSWSQIPPSEAADWVEYVNGDSSTELGALRAEHGYPEPWGVTNWQIGNEVWGVYQVGHSDADTYATRYEAYRDAMTDADPSIEVDATGIDPRYTDYSDGSVLSRGLGQPPTWNDKLFATAGDGVEGLDIHHYTAGIKTDAARNAWCLQNDRDPVDYNEALVAYPTQFGRNVSDHCDAVTEEDVDDLRINVGEWNLQPFVGDDWPRANYPTVAHAAYVASMYNAFIRHGNHFELAYQRDNTLYHRPYPIDTRPVNPGNYVQRFYAEPFVTGGDWHRVDVDVSAPTVTAPSMGWRIAHTDAVPTVDVAAVRSNVGAVVVFAVNRDLRSTHEVEFDVDGLAGSWDVPVTMLAGEDGDPFARRTSWERVDGFELTEHEAPVEDGAVSVSMPPASIARLDVVRSDG